MRYEKKMLILSGDGKGVVMIERSALGVKYALRTFDVDADGLKVGIITPTAVFVREIPSGKDPSAVFYTDDTELDALHFAVFGRELVLYGATGKKMWEANVMDVLKRRADIGGEPVPAPQKLPPLAPKPDKLPMPDGTGIPQSRDAIYGDDALAESDFYTPFELAPRMKQVDKFLDTPRMLDGLSPTIEKRLPDPSVPPITKTAEPATQTAKEQPTAAAASEPDRRASVPHAAEQPASGATATAAETETETSNANAITDTAPLAEVPASADASATPTEKPTAEKETSIKEPQADAFAATEADPTVHTEQAANPAPTYGQAEPTAEAAASADAEMPWRMEAAYLSGLATRSVSQARPHTAQKIKPRPEIRKLREATFFERSRQDVEKLFATAAADGELAALLPELKWVKVRFDGHAVSVGQGGTVLCYAVAGLYEKSSPFGDKAQWLPKLKNAPTGKGYWLIFQDLASGDIVGAV